MLGGELEHLAGADEPRAVPADVSEVPRLEVEALQGGIDGIKPLYWYICISHSASLREETCHEVVPRHHGRILLPHLRQDALDIGSEDGVGRDEGNLAWVQGITQLVEEVGDALHHHRGLAAPRRAYDQQCRNVFVADDGVLFLLDGSGDGLHVAGLALFQ